MLQKAREMQEKMKQAQDQIKNIEVEGISGGNLVKVILKGDYELKSIIISVIYFCLGVVVFYLSYFGAKKRGTLINMGE